MTLSWMMMRTSQLSATFQFRPWFDYGEDDYGEDDYGEDDYGDGDDGDDVDDGDE